MARPKTLVSRIPTITLLFACATLLVYVLPFLSELFVYDRQAILDGELWRIVTAPLVHFSMSHLLWNVLAFSAAGWAVETTVPRGLWVVCIFSSITPGLLFLWTSPELIRYGGLSGLATGVVAYLCFCKIMKPSKVKAFWLLILALIGVKIMIEVITVGPLFVWAETPFQVLPSTHVLGCIGAFVALMWSRPNQKIQEVTVEPVR